MHPHSNISPGKVEKICQFCGTIFTLKRSIVLTGRGQFCSAACRYASTVRPLEERFWAKVEKSTGCWNWTAAKNPKGYGIFCIEKKTNSLELAHRVSYRLHYGAIPEDLRVLHHCDNPTCVRPDHLFLGTDGDNTADKVAKNRQQKGEHHALAKLTDAQATEIRRRYAAGGVSQAQLAREYSINHATMGSLIHRKTWHHLP